MPTHPVPAAVRPAAWLLGQLAAARVFDDGQLRPYLAEFAAAHPRGDAAALANYLVQAGILTPFQADRAVAGEGARIALGPYLLAEPVGTGSLGTVYQAVGRQDRKRYAVKVLPLRSLWNVHLAKRQVQQLAALPPHPAVVPLVDIDTAGGSHYLAWPFAAGTTLAERVRRAGPLPVFEAVRVMTQAAEGLVACHTAGVTHGLLKPSNLILGRDGQTRVLDLGMGAILSENIADDESLLDTISTANTAMGMIDCCAPETLTDPSLRSPAGDLYSFGCVLYFVLTGSLPFPDGNVVDKVIAHQTQPPPAVRGRNPDVPGWLAELVGRLMSKAPGDRPTAVALLAALRAGPAAGNDTPPAGFAVTPLLPLPADRPAAAAVSFDAPPAGAGDSSMTGRMTAGVPRPSAMSLGELWLAESSLPKLDTVPNMDGLSAGDLPAIARPVDATPPPPAAPAPAVPTLTVVVPPLPAFARAGWRRLLSYLFFWRPATDVVQVSLFGPAAVAPGETVPLQAYVHTPQAFDSVRTLARAFHPTDDLLAVGFLDRPVAGGSAIGLHLAVAGAGVGRALVMLNWLGQPQPRTFEVNVPWEGRPGPAAAALSAAVDGVLAGKLDFRLVVQPRTG
jgi:serine/threonine protein kinase